MIYKKMLRLHEFLIKKLIRYDKIFNFYFNYFIRCAALRSLDGRCAPFKTKKRLRRPENVEIA